MAKKSSDIQELDDNKIRQTIWMLEHNNATKKSACEFLGIAYNTKRLEKILDEYKQKINREKELREKNKNKVFSKTEIDAIINDYISGTAISNISKSLYVTDYKIKKILKENNVPLRGRGKKTPANTEHVVQDLDSKFSINDKVFFAQESSFAIIDKIYDEELIEELSNPITELYIEHPSNIYGRNNKRICEEENMVEDIHYTVYCVYDNDQKIKRSAVSNILKFIDNGIASTGREFYRIWVLGDNKRFRHASREQLFPVKEN